MIGESIELNGVTYTYPSSGFTLATGDLVLDAGRITFIAGQNGSGKTTMAKLIAGVLKPQSGEIVLMGTSSCLLSLGEIGRRIGYLWQNPRQQLFARTALDELTFAESIKNPKRTQEEKKTAEENALRWLEYFDIAGLKDKSCFYMSHGEKQRLALAAVIASGAGYLVLDEPAKGLDGRRKEALIKLLMKLRVENNIGMSVISHDEKFTAELKERVIILSEGKVADDRN